MASPFQWQSYAAHQRQAWVCIVFNAQLSHREHTWIRSLLGTKPQRSTDGEAGGEAAEHRLWLPWMKLPHSTARTELSGFCGSSVFGIYTDSLLCQEHTVFKYTNSIISSRNLSNRYIHANLPEEACLHTPPQSAGTKLTPALNTSSLWKDLSKRRNSISTTS